MWSFIADVRYAFRLPRQSPGFTFVAANFFDWRDQNHSFIDMAATRGRTRAVTPDGPAEQLAGFATTGSCRATLCFATAGAISSFLLTLPPQFRATRDSHFLNVVARLKSGVTVRQVSDDMLAIANDLKQLYPDSNRYTGARAAFEEADAESLVYHVRPLEDYLAGRLADRRFARALLALFGCLRQMLAGVGAYRVMSYPVALGTREIGLRMALGADARATAGVVLRQSMATTLAGVMISLAAALALTHWLSALLFKARPADPAALGSVTNPLVVVTLAAPAIPARGAAAVDPKAVLRQE